MIIPSKIDRYMYILEEARVVPRLTMAMRRDSRGRPTNTDLIRLFMLGLMLSVDHRGKATIRSIQRALTKDLTLDDQIRVGVRTVDGRVVVTENALQNVARMFHQRLEYGPVTASDLTADERNRRCDAVQDVLDAICDVFIRDFTPQTVAIDATNLWTWSRSGKRKPRRPAETEWEDHVDTPNADATADNADEEPEPAAAENDESPGDTRSDAAWGAKTAKDGNAEWFYGYHEHTVVLAPHGKEDPDQPPPLIVRYTLTSPKADLSVTTLALIDRTLDRIGDPGKKQITDVIVDRHYSYKRSESWRDELALRGISQTFDLRKDEQGWTDLDGVRFAAGVPHCPGAPDDLGVIPGLGLNPSPSEVAAFKAKIELRKQYRLRKNREIDPVTGKAQWECPARAGTVGCPLVAGTLQAAGHLMIATGQSIPIIDSPPDPNDPICPKICTQATVVIDPGELRKLIQREYWGSDEWRHMHAKRSVVEGSYGNRKNPDTENLRRGHHRAGGIGRTMLYSIGAVASYNLRMLRNWHNRTGLGDPSHPLLRPDDNVYGYVAITEDEYAERLRAAS